MQQMLSGFVASVKRLWSKGCIGKAAVILGGLVVLGLCGSIAGGGRARQAVTPTAPAQAAIVARAATTAPTPEQEPSATPEPTATKAAAPTKAPAPAPKPTDRAAGPVFAGDTVDPPSPTPATWPAQRVYPARSWRRMDW
jgi:hypothetical protein